MTLEYQIEVLKFLAQSKESKKYLPLLEENIFDLQENQIVFKLLQSYWKNYNGQPALANMLEYFRVESRKTKIDPKVKSLLDKQIREIYKPLTAHTTQIRESLIQQIQYKRVKLLFTDNIDKLNDGMHIFKSIRKEITDIISLENKIEGKEQDPKENFLLSSFTKARYKDLMVGLPTFLKKLNGMTSIGGFCSPQLVLFMGAPKSFKTGMLLNTVMPYVRMGKKVFYADLENGANDIKLRAAQCMSESTFNEIQKGSVDDLMTDLVKMYKVKGGDLYVKSFQAYISTVADIEAELDVLAEEFGWIPDIIAIDYADLLKPVDKKITEKRLQIQSVYFDIKNMNSRRDVLTFTLSQVSRNAVDKKVINMKDFAEDFGKAANCDAAFAICQTREERKVNLARLIPVVQRKGIQYNGTMQDTCNIRIDYEHQRIIELEMEEVLNLLDAATVHNNPELAPDSDKLEDE